MDYLFLILALLTLILLVASVVKPGVNKKTGKPFRRKNVGICFGLAFLVFIILTGLTAPKTTNLANKNVTVGSTAPESIIKASSAIKKPTITTKTTTTTSPIPYTTSIFQDPSLAKGSTSVQTKGVNGIQTTTWLVTSSNGAQTSKKQVSVATTTAPVNEVIDQGTYVAPPPTQTPSQTPSASCHPLTDSGSCYEPGEYCRDSDKGTSGVAGDGEAITCEDNDGWRWEPS